ncbi:hypothetical protein FRB94_013106 [Tulasnella sp. JGI-2019a]|nr:hypothetical protein FRB94_013106 [Tulasnella sp. JGI-2019a]
MPRRHKPERPAVFGEKRDFWGKYDNLARKKDQVMIGPLDKNLDALLIFAGLFSAINTAFVVLTIPTLTAPPSYRTNALLTLIAMQAGNSTITPSDLNPPFSPSHAAIRQNCMFFASLCTSILVATGGVLAKQWLRIYERDTRQIGSQEMQALIRRKKWLAAESWGLRQVVEALPTLLLISVGLFFAALSDLLWFTNKPVALAVIAITAIGAASYGFTMIAGALDTFCPYQFAGSAVIRKLALESITILSVFSSSWRFIGAGLERFVGGIFRRTQMVRISSKRIRDAWRFVRGDCWIMV